MLTQKLFFEGKAVNENEAAENHLQITLDRIITRESFRQLCLSKRYNPNGYSSFGVWLNNETNMSEAERKRVCHQLAEVKMICDARHMFTQDDITSTSSIEPST